MKQNLKTANPNIQHNHHSTIGTLGQSSKSRCNETRIHNLPLRLVKIHYRERVTGQRMRRGAAFVQCLLQPLGPLAWRSILHGHPVARSHWAYCPVVRYLAHGAPGARSLTTSSLTCNLMAAGRGINPWCTSERKTSTSTEHEGSVVNAM
jgi:hypothetical protein